jgi:D-alanyl-D-alanine carboxypeptidase (penicillin-binding protein 5/6)
MVNTTFKNATGLDAEDHLTSARDIAIMSAELLKHPLITEYTTIWMDELRNGETQLVNTNKLVRFYEGTTGLKTGTTDDAKYCLAASATRNGLSLIAVVLGADTSDNRFGSARGLLDYGFANFEVLPTPQPDPALSPVRVSRGVAQQVELQALMPEKLLVEKGMGIKSPSSRSWFQS